MHDRRGERRARPFDDMDEPVSKRASLGVFSRLSGTSVKGARRDSFDQEEFRGAAPHKVRRTSVHMAREEGELELEDSNTFRPAIASSITRTGGEKTRAEAAVAVADKASVSRNKRMFGALLGTLQSFRKDEAKQKDKEEQRQAVEKKLEERGEKMREEMAAERRRQWEEKKQREVHQRRLAEHEEKVKELDKWIVYQLKLCNFIRTENSPQIFWLPKVSSRAAEKAQKSTRDKLTEEIYERKAELEDELKELMSSNKKSSHIDRNNSDVESEYEYRTTLVHKGKELTKDLTSRLGPMEGDSPPPPKKGEALGRMVVRVGGGFGSERVVEVGQKKKTVIKPEDMRDIKIKVEREKDGGEEKENRKILLKKDTRREEEGGKRNKSPLRSSGKEEANKEDKDFDDEVSRMRKRIVEKARKMTEEKNKKGRMTEEKNKKGKITEEKSKKGNMNGHNKEKETADKSQDLEDGVDDMTEASKSVFHDDILNIDVEEHQETNEEKETTEELEDAEKSTGSKDKKVVEKSNVENRSSRHSSHSESIKNGESENKSETSNVDEIIESKVEKKAESKANKSKKSGAETEVTEEASVTVEKTSPKKRKLGDDKSPKKGNKSPRKQKSPKKKSPVKKDSRGSSSSEESSSDSEESSSSDSSESSGGESSSEGESSEEERNSEGKRSKPKDKREYKESDSDEEKMRRPPQKRKKEMERSTDRKRR